MAVGRRHRQAVLSAWPGREQAADFSAAPRIEDPVTGDLSRLVRDAEPGAQRHRQMHRAEGTAGPEQSRTDGTKGFASLRDDAFVRPGSMLSRVVGGLALLSGGEKRFRRLTGQQREEHLSTDLVQRARHTRLLQCLGQSTDVPVRQKSARRRHLPARDRAVS